MALMVANVRIEGEDPRPAIAARLDVAVGAVLEVELVKKSLDARKGRQVWTGLYRVEVVDEASVLARAKGVRAWTERDDGRYGRIALAPEYNDRSDTAIVVGAGPAGLFAALWLAEAGVKVTLFERGGPVEDRVPAVNGHWRGRLPLDPENNLIFGEGGAGTFSDGKIYTRRRDGELGFIFTRLVDFGADRDVLTEAYAHLGTDRIRAILPPFRTRLAELGVDLRFHTQVKSLVMENGRCVGVPGLRADHTLVATGHSARDSVRMLLDAGVVGTPSTISIGARIEHPQTLIDEGRYHKDRGDLPPASYRLTHEGARKSHTFCMCPGGMVVPASNHPDQVAVNGMSFAARRARYANSAVIVEVRPEDYGSEDPMAGFAFQDRIERACFATGGTPAQRVVDLLAGRVGELPEGTSYPLPLVATDLRTVMPDFIVDGMIEAILAFDVQIPGFAGPDALLIAPETRTTSPIRYERNDRCEALPGLYTIGEGAGYGGGIISSALDGLRAARAITQSK